jgi:hypothetical protein
LKIEMSCDGMQRSAGGYMERYIDTGILFLRRGVI